jgi:hypothetical protein
MMELTDAITTTWTYLSVSFTLQLFTVSAMLLLGGLFLKVWRNAVQLSFLEINSLKEIELTHPHIPSLKVIVTIFLCTTSLLVVVLQTSRGAPPFEQPFEWLKLAGFFLLMGSAGTLAELKYQGTRDIAFSFVIGTALAFVYIAFKFWLIVRDFLLMGALLTLLVFCIALAWRVLLRSWTPQCRVVAMSTFILWILLYIA